MGAKRAHEQEQGSSKMAAAAITTLKTGFFIIIPAVVLVNVLLFTPLIAGDYVLYNGEVLMAGQNLTNGPNHLAMQSNCDLVLYHGGKPAWNTKTNTTANTTAGAGSCYAVLKQNGELVVRRNVHYILWTSAKKAKKGKYALVLDGAGRIGIYGQRRWVSNNQKEEVHELSRPVVSTEYVLQSGGHWRLSPGKKLKYREYELGLSRCNLEINSTRTGRTLWQTNTKAASCFVELESNGELMVKHGSKRLWSSGRKGERGKYVAVLRFDGRLAAYGPLLWSNAQWDEGGDDDMGNGSIVDEAGYYSD